MQKKLLQLSYLLKEEFWTRELKTSLSISCRWNPDYVFITLEDHVQSHCLTNS